MGQDYSTPNQQADLNPTQTPTCCALLAMMAAKALERSVRVSPGMSLTCDT